MAVAGAITVSWTGSGGGVAQFSAGSLPIGSLFIVAAVVSEALYMVLSRRVRAPAVVGAFRIALIGAFLFMPFALWELWALGALGGLQGSGVGFVWPAWQDWWPIMYLGVLVTALGFFCWFYASRRLPAYVVGVYASLVPITAVLLAVFVLGEMLMTRHLIGGGLVLAAILAVALPQANRAS